MTPAASEGCIIKRAMSNIAWAPAERDAAYGLLQRYGFTGVEIAPGLLFPDAPDPFAPGAAAIEAARRDAAGYGLGFVSMQSLLFGCEGAALFEDAAARARLVAQMRRAIVLAQDLEIANIVFGSPKNRYIPDGLGREAAYAIAAETFAALGDFAAAREVRIAVEPNPAAYGANFLVTVEEAAAFVASLAHPAVTLNFDLGAIAMAGAVDRLEHYLSLYRGMVSHIHLSEPQLAPAPASADMARRLDRAAEAAGYGGWISIEMRRPETAPLETIEACLRRCAG